MKINSRIFWSPKTVWLIALLISTVVVSASAQSSNWPATTKIIVPLPAGGGVDVSVRKLGEVLGTKLGTTVIVDNRPGASGLIGAKAASAASSDGSIIFYLHPGLITMQVITGRLDILSEFKAVSKISSGPYFLVVPANSPYKSQAELLSAIKAQPDKLNYGSGGTGSPAHLAFEWLDDRTPGGLKATHIPFKGNIEAVTALIGGDIDFAFGLVSVVNEHIKSGKLRALSTTSATRLTLMPNLPTVAEAGVPGYVFDAWGALVVPAKTPDAVVAKLFESVKFSAHSQEFSSFLSRNASLVEVSASPAALTEQLRTYILDEKKIVDRLGLKTP